MLFKILIKGYQLLVSPFFGDCCRFYPSCSEYSLAAVEKYGALKGLWLTLKRVLKCNPWHPGGHDDP